MYCFIVSAQREWMHPDTVVKVTNELVSTAKACGAVVWRISGKWEGVPESSILGIVADEAKCEQLACGLGRRFNQDAVVANGKLLNPITGEVLTRFTHLSLPVGDDNFSELAGVRFALSGDKQP